MYITSSRKPSLTTKRLGRTLARLLPRGIYENRGKKSVEEIAARAKTLGKSRAMLVHEHKGNPEKLVFMEIGKEWKWLSPQVRIIKLGKLPKIEIKSTSMEIIGTEKNELSGLFNLEKTPDPDIVLESEEESWSFFSGKKKLLSFGVVYGKE